MSPSLEISSPTDEIERYKSLIEDKYRQQIENLKSAYNHLYELYIKTRNESYEKYNQLHAKFISHDVNKESTDLM